MGSAACGCWPPAALGYFIVLFPEITTGFNPLAQGCAGFAGTTLGPRPQTTLCLFFRPSVPAARPDGGKTKSPISPFPQGSSFLATLG